VAQFEVETVALDSLQPHPRNYRAHPEEQVEAIAASLQQFGQYRPIVVSSDGYILAGEGVWRGRQKAGCADIDAVRMPFAHDDPRAEKLLVADNELSRLAEDDDKVLAALLADIERTETGLAGTGWNDSELDALIGRMAASPYSPNVSPSIDVREYTDRDIEAEKKRLDDQFKREKELDPVTCPHCGGEFFVDK